MKSFKIESIVDKTVKLVSGETTKEIAMVGDDNESGFEVGGVIIFADDGSVSKVLSKAEVDALPDMFQSKPGVARTSKKKETTRGSGQGSYRDKTSPYKITF